MRCSTSRRSWLARSSSSRDLRRAQRVLGEEQLEPGVGAVQAPGRVQPRREREAERALVDAARVDARDRHQRAQPRLARRRQRAQATAHERAVLADQRDHVGDRRERDEVEVVLELARVAPAPLA